MTSALKHHPLHPAVTNLALFDAQKSMQDILIVPSALPDNTRTIQVSPISLTEIMKRMLGQVLLVSLWSFAT